jgi:hypothetical protein
MSSSYRRHPEPFRAKTNNIRLDGASSTPLANSATYSILFTLQS